MMNKMMIEIKKINMMKIVKNMMRRKLIKMLKMRMVMKKIMIKMMMEKIKKKKNENDEEDDGNSVSRQEGQHMQHLHMCPSKCDHIIGPWDLVRRLLTEEAN